MTASIPHIIVDGYNLILRTERLDLKQEQALFDARRRLVMRLGAFNSGKRQRITVVFDGADSSGSASNPSSGGIEVIFSRPPQKADQTILGLIEKSKQARNITLVTSDSALARMAAGCGCTIVSSELFMKRLASGMDEEEYIQKYKAQISSKDLDEWLKLFNDEPERP